MPEVMMAIGPFVFAMDTAAHQKLTTASPIRWARQDRIGRGPALQFLGADSETIDLEGVIYPGYQAGGTASSMDDLRELAFDGEPLDLVDGQGEVWGVYVIEEVEDTYTFMHSNGAPRKIEFKIRLRIYGVDGAPDADTEGAVVYGPNDPNIAALMSVQDYPDPALISGGNNGLAGVLGALASAARIAQQGFPGSLTGTVGGSLRPIIADDGSIILTGTGGVGVGLDGVGRVGLSKSLSVTVGNTGGGDAGGGGAAP